MRSITISVFGITQRSASLPESALNWDASGIWSNGGSWIRLNVSYKAAADARPVFLRAVGATSVKSRHFTTGFASKNR